MNQQLIFNHDHQFDDAAVAVRCSILQGGLRNTVYIRMPEGWTAEAWLAQVREDSFFWEDEIELALKKASSTRMEAYGWMVQSEKQRLDFTSIWWFPEFTTI